MTKELNKNDSIELTIETLSHGGDGIGKHNGLAIFVPNSIPGDQLQIHITEVKKRYAKGRIVKIVEPSPNRIKPVCPISDVCGGCQWQHVDYSHQLEAKQKIVSDNLNRIGNIIIPINPIIHGDDLYHYRCKVRLGISQKQISGELIIGYNMKGSHDLINVKTCPIQPSILDEITLFIRNIAQEQKLSAYNKSNDTGSIFQITYKYSFSTKNILVILDVYNEEKENEQLIELCKNLFEKFDAIAGVLLQAISFKKNRLNYHELKLVVGQDNIEEHLSGRRFKISANSFFQVNSPVAIKMFDYIYQLVQEKSQGKSLLDLYSGVGNFSIWLEDLFQEIIGIEENPLAIEDALENVKQIKHPEKFSMIQGSVDKVSTQLLEEKRSFDLVLLDPPRQGCSPKIIDSISKLAKKNILYVSCDPATLARDLKLLNEKGFQTILAQPFDLFPQTYHVETVTLLEKM